MLSKRVTSITKGTLDTSTAWRHPTWSCPFCNGDLTKRGGMAVDWVSKHDFVLLGDCARLYVPLVTSHAPRSRRLVLCSQHATGGAFWKSAKRGRRDWDDDCENLRLVVGNGEPVPTIVSRVSSIHLLREIIIVEIRASGPQMEQGVCSNSMYVAAADRVGVSADQPFWDCSMI